MIPAICIEDNYKKYAINKASFHVKDFAAYWLHKALHRSTASVGVNERKNKIYEWYLHLPSTVKIFSDLKLSLIDNE